MPAIKNLKRDTHEILVRFNKDIAPIVLNDQFKYIELLQRADKLFYDLRKLNPEEVANIFTFYNFTSINVQENEKYQETLNYLIAASVKKNSLSDLLRYFLPEYLSQEEAPPEPSNSKLKLWYWIQRVGFWSRQLRNKLNYVFKREFSEVADSIQYIKNVLNTTYIADSVNEEFKKHLGVVREKILEKNIFLNRNKISRTNLSNDQAYHQELMVQEKELQGFGNLLLEMKKDLDEKEVHLQKLFDARLNSLSISRENLPEGKELFNNERKDSEEQIKTKEQSKIGYPKPLNTGMYKSKNFADSLNSNTETSRSKLLSLRI